MLHNQIHFNEKPTDVIKNVRGWMGVEGMFGRACSLIAQKNIALSMDAMESSLLIG